jgi:hypothetical protein
MSGHKRTNKLEYIDGIFVGLLGKIVVAAVFALLVREN